MVPSEATLTIVQNKHKHSSLDSYLHTVKSNKKQNKHKHNSFNSYLKLVYIIPITITFFLIGVYFGSSFFHHDQSNELLIIQSPFNNIGLPRTSNKLHKWNEKLTISKQLRYNSSLLTNTTNTSSLKHHKEEIRSKLDIKESLYASSQSYIIAPNNLDNNEIIVAAWIYLNKTTNDNDMRTIFSNKMPGCDIGIDI